ncbi:MAG: branched-chain alpha-keto acid dehydrogenase subunit E2 [Gammaproteobacteria bacterium HGW-Gammaproteobacteria-2]|jgi:pyruvate dehydrogenase E2 component (dihydrolipoamide acetyltransferase)|nr:MAG: branched-chain alpha-keto acid dehydrogenase subunit E2 [Gammaproteobacteria bacterium HGW-Gammaproteobacteria-2]
MSKTKTFFLPDLGEGLPDATIVEWMVKPGDSIALDEPLVSMETAKAVVEVPSPVSGKVLALAGSAGDVITTGAVLAEFEIDSSKPQRAEGHDTGHHHGVKPASKTPDTPVAESARAADSTAEPEPDADAGTVVGAMESSNRVHAEQASQVGGVKAMPAVRALAKKLHVDLALVSASGAGGVITLKDVKDAATAGTAPLLPSPTGRGVGGEGAVGAHDRNGPEPSSALRAASDEATSQSTRRQSRQVAGCPGGRREERTVFSASGKPMRTSPPGTSASGQPEQLKGVRRNMARVMADAHAKVALTTICDDADLHAWIGKQDITARLVRAIVAACKAVPALNAWFDGDKLVRTLHSQVDIGIAVDTDDGLFVPALRNADMLDASSVRGGIQRLRAQVADRSIAASELSGYTISLSNFGMFAGRYATPVVVPPTVAIIGAGKLSHDVVAVIGGIEVHRRLPLSLSFDHRACTGGEAARFLAALIDDLSQPN